MLLFTHAARYGFGLLFFWSFIYSYCYSCYLETETVEDRRAMPPQMVEQPQHSSMRIHVRD